jgi:hypothetical protein
MPAFRADQVEPAIWKWIQKIFEDETVLQDAIAGFRARQAEYLRPLQTELNLIEQTIADMTEEHLEHTRSLGRLSDSMTLAIANTQAAIARCEQQIAELNAKHKAATKALETAKQGEQNIQSAVDFVAAIKAELGYLDWDGVSFETRRLLVDRLNVEITLVLEDEEKYLDARCYLDSKGTKFPVTTYTKPTNQRRLRPPTSKPSTI